jgi:ankyrin repeat protein
MKHLLLTTIAAVVLVGCGGPPEVDRALHKAAGAGNIEAVKQHLAAGADVDVKGGFMKGAPLHFAAGNGHKEIAELLIAKGADVNAKDDIDYTPLDWADGKTETAALLRKHGGKHGTIHSAVEGGDAEAVKEFLAAGADVNAKNNTGWALLHSAAYDGRKEIVELLIAKGADVNVKSADGSGGRTPLHFAAYYGHEEIVELLISKGADVNAKRSNGATPLDLALGETADLLRKHGGKTGEGLKAAGN